MRFYLDSSGQKKSKEFGLETLDTHFQGEIKGIQLRSKGFESVDDRLVKWNTTTEVFISEMFAEDEFEVNARDLAGDTEYSETLFAEVIDGVYSVMVVCTGMCKGVATEVRRYYFNLEGAKHDRVVGFRCEDHISFD